jgi:predicted nucleotidyltransferase
MRPASPDTGAVLAEIVRRLIVEFQPERIHLFGSCVRGDASPERDHGLLMVLGQLSGPTYRLAPRAHSVDLAAAPPLIGAAVFHCQQATEKSLKAFLALPREVYPAVISRLPGEVRL